MTAEPPDKTPGPNAKLRAIIAAFNGKGFALVDGGHFDDLPALLKRERLFGRSLFLDTADEEVQTAGPWLVKLDQEPEATEKVLALVQDRPAAVFWCCDAGEDVLYRHLRTLNMARIPVWAAEGLEAPPDGHDASLPEVHDAVLFRHWDPSVLGSLMPVLDADQFARMIGPAAEFVYWAEEYGGMMRVVHDPEWPPAASGPLTLGTGQIEALAERRLNGSQRRIAVYLREVFPDVSPKVPDDELLALVQKAGATGRSLGIETEAGHRRWAYLVMASDGRVLRTPGALRFIQNGEASPDEQVRVMINRIVGRLRQDAGRPKNVP